MRYEWDFSVVISAIPDFMRGLGITAILAIVSMISGMILGLFISLARLSKRSIISYIAYIYIEIFRSIPLLMVLLWMYYSLPIMAEITFSSFTTACFALTLNLAAFTAEVYRSGILSIGKDQSEAAKALGMTSNQVMRRIILPQAIRRIIPPLGSIWVSLFKDSSIVSIIAVSELMYYAGVWSNKTYRPVEIYTVVALIYFIVTYPQARFADNLYKRIREKN